MRTYGLLLAGILLAGVTVAVRAQPGPPAAGPRTTINVNELPGGHVIISPAEEHPADPAASVPAMVLSRGAGAVLDRSKGSGGRG